MKPLIIPSKLDNDMEVKLLGVLERNSKAFAWSIEDIKGISLSVCMHKILMEEDAVLPWTNIFISSTAATPFSFPASYMAPNRS